MSNEFKDYLWDTIGNIVLDSGAMDKIEDIPNPSYEKTYVYGQKDEKRVLLEVWLDDDTGEWRIEHREIDK